MTRASKLLRLAAKASQASSRSISTNGKGLGGAASQAVGCAGGSTTNAPGATPASFQQTRGAVSGGLA
jgi:hypothetical protein